MRHQKKITSAILTLILGIALYLYHSYTPATKTMLAPTTAPTSAYTSPSATIATVARVIDGDTIQLSDGKKVRYIGVDSPELHHPTKGVQCFGKEAMEENKKLVEGKKIRMEKDVSETDRYGRLLRFIFIENPVATSEEIFVNDYLVRKGFAHVATFPPDVAHVDEFRSGELEARTKNLGLWKSCQ